MKRFLTPRFCADSWILVRANQRLGSKIGQKFGSFFMYIKLEKKCQNETFVRKIRAFNIDEIDT
jgi:hypothetical protein